MVSLPSKLQAWFLRSARVGYGKWEWTSWRRGEGGWQGKGGWVVGPGCGRASPAPLWEVGLGLRGPGVCCLTQWFVVSQSHRPDDNVAGPQEDHALPDECHGAHQPPSAAESDDLGLRWVRHCGPNTPTKACARAGVSAENGNYSSKETGACGQVISIWFFYGRPAFSHECALPRPCLVINS